MSGAFLHSEGFTLNMKNPGSQTAYRSVAQHSGRGTGAPGYRVLCTGECTRRPQKLSRPMGVLYMVQGARETGRRGTSGPGAKGGKLGAAMEGVYGSVVRRRYMVPEESLCDVPASGRAVAGTVVGRPPEVCLVSAALCCDCCRAARCGPVTLVLW